MTGKSFPIRPSRRQLTAFHIKLDEIELRQVQPRGEAIDGKNTALVARDRRVLPGLGLVGARRRLPLVNPGHVDRTASLSLWASATAALINITLSNLQSSLIRSDKEANVGGTGSKV